MGIIAKIAPHNTRILDKDFLDELYDSDRILWLTVNLEALFDPDPMHTECHKLFCEVVEGEIEYGRRGPDGMLMEAPIG